MYSRGIVLAFAGLLLLGGCAQSSGGPSTGTTASSTAGSVATGTEFRDPKGAWAITIDPGWKPIDGSNNVSKAWLIAPVHDNFGANVNVLTQDVPGVDLARYLQLSSKSTGGLKFLGASTVDVGSGRQLGRLEYAGEAPSGRQIHALTYVDVRDGTAVLATLTTLPGDFDATAPGFEPYLRTVRAT